MSDKKKVSEASAETQEGVFATKKKAFASVGLFNVFLFIGLLVLYGLYFFGSGTRQAVPPPAERASRVMSAGQETGISIAYVHSEKLMAQYELAIKMRGEFEQEQRRLESDLSRRQRQFQTEVGQFQKDLSTGEVPMDLAQMKEQELMQKQQELYQLSETYRERLAEKEFEMNLELLEKISDFLERYNRDSRYDFIFSYSLGGNMLYAEATHDITDVVLQRLNAEFNASL
jgi:outer membrane protein